MKEIKAYVSCKNVCKVILALEEAGYKGFTMVEMVSMGSSEGLIDSATDNLFECPENTKMVKLVITCVDKDVDKFVQVIFRYASIGMKGKGTSVLPT